MRSLHLIAFFFIIIISKYIRVFRFFTSFLFITDKVLFREGVFVKASKSDDGFCSAPSITESDEEKPKPIYWKVTNPTLSPSHLQGSNVIFLLQRSSLFYLRVTEKSLILLLVKFDFFLFLVEFYLD